MHDRLRRRVAEGRDAATIDAIAGELSAHGCPSEQIESVIIYMSPTFIKGCVKSLPNACVIFDKFDVAWLMRSKTDFYQSRNFSLVHRVAQRYYVLSKGAVVEQGDVEGMSMQDLKKHVAV